MLCTFLTEWPSYTVASAGHNSLQKGDSALHDELTDDMCMVGTTTALVLACKRQFHTVLQDDQDSNTLPEIDAIIAVGAVSAAWEVLSHHHVQLLLPLLRSPGNISWPHRPMRIPNLACTQCQQ